MKNLSSSLFHAVLNVFVPKAGATLIAQPFAEGCHRHRALVSIIDHLDSEGTTGVVLNRPMGMTLDQVVSGIDPESRIPVFCGGPSDQDTLFFIHTLGPDVLPGSREYAPGLYVGGDISTIRSYINSGYPVEGYVRFFAGYTFWGEGELEEQMADRQWAMDEAPEASTVLSGIGDSAWYEAVRAQGEALRAWTLVPRHAFFN